MVYWRILGAWKKENMSAGVIWRRFDAICAAKWNIKTGLGALNTDLDALKNIVIFKAKLPLLYSFLNSRPGHDIVYLTNR